METLLFFSVKRKIGLIAMLLSFSLYSFADITCTSIGGNWSSNATWIGGIVPTELDTVNINTGTVAMNAGATVFSLMMQSNRFSDGERLLVTENFIFYAGTQSERESFTAGVFVKFINL